MKLQYLILSNIGPFRGRHTVDLNSDNESTGYAFFAENGRGKTSIYNAMRWCLFGEVSERAKTVGGNTISGSVRPIVGDGKILMNDEAYENDDPQEMSVMLIAEGEKGKITVQRTATSTTKLARSDDDLKIDDEDLAAMGTSSGRKERFFWQYNVQAKGPKGQKLALDTKIHDPHQLNEVIDPVFSDNVQVHGIKHRYARNRQNNYLSVFNCRKIILVAKLGAEMEMT